MELTWPAVPALCAAGALLLLAVLVRRARRRPAPGELLLAHTDRLSALPAFRRRARRRRARLAALAVALLVTAGAASVLAARPVSVQRVEPDSRSRDVVLCLDVSSSMGPADAALLDTFLDVVRLSPRERIGLVLFASRPVQVFPLTDDHAYVEEQLRRVRAAYDERTTGSAAWAGTTGGDGTSVIGDGIATCVTSFDRLDTPRPRSLLLATDAVVSGSPLVGTTEAGALAAARGIRIHALNPADPTGTARDAASAELRAIAERSGGSYAGVGGPGSVAAVVAAVDRQEAARFTGSPQLVRSDDPRPAALVATVAFVLALLLALPDRGPAARWVLVRRGGALVLLLAIGLRPGLPGDAAPLLTRDVDVYLVVDDTVSMAAEDHGAGRPRIEGARADVAALVARFAGARFSTIASGSTAVQTMPLTTDATAAVTSVQALLPSALDSTAGSDPRAAGPLLHRLLAEGAERSPGRAQLVFVLGDGERTSDTAASAFRSADVSGGAVLGYGTTAGGRMRDAPAALLYGGDGGPYVLDTRGGTPTEAVSHADPDELRAVAGELGVPFVARAAGEPIDPALVDARPGELRPAAGEAAVRRPLSGWLALVLLLAVVGELAALLTAVLPRRRPRVPAEGAR
ncbi:VWA domain-containing protein [Kineococcus rubinsiae]|uniref:VWA domain-containing protein n=1 Tax=Kineococcus rubinsiae TaxID=2609562 RepID=UPI001431DE04|nr:VWA domain-containing protein [Kineococcus rubinsiae]NIZ93580.1 VWA domain-containing protein [Kineococcus rubinsiae]